MTPGDLIAVSGPRHDGLTSDPLLHLFQELVDGQHPADAAGDVLQGKHVEILAIHAGDAIGDHHHGEISIQGGKGGKALSSSQRRLRPAMAANIPDIQAAILANDEGSGQAQE